MSVGWEAVMLQRRAFLCGAISTALAVPFAVETHAERVSRIGYLAAGSADAYAAAFLQELHRLGWTEGRNLVVERRWAGGKTERLSDFARSLVDLAPAAIVAVTTPAAHAAASATSTIPIVFTMVADPVGSGFVASLARPGRNVTGLTFVPELAFFDKQLELLKEIVGGVSRIVVVWNPLNPVHPTIADRLTQVTAARLGLEVLDRPVQDVDALDRVFAGVAAAAPTACLVVADFTFFVQRQRLVDLAAKERVPVMYGATEFTEAGGLVSYAPDLVDMQRRAAAYVDRILRGAEPAHLPVERPSKFELAINLKTARTLGLTIPPSLLLRADKVIE